jgi:hypothetical protein
MLVNDAMLALPPALYSGDMTGSAVYSRWSWGCSLSPSSASLVASGLSDAIVKGLVACTLTTLVAA